MSTKPPPKPEPPQVEDDPFEEWALDDVESVLVRIERQASREWAACLSPSYFGILETVPYAEWERMGTRWLSDKHGGGQFVATLLEPNGRRKRGYSPKVITIAGEPKLPPNLTAPKADATPAAPPAANESLTGLVEMMKVQIEADRERARQDREAAERRAEAAERRAEADRKFWMDMATRDKGKSATESLAEIIQIVHGVKELTPDQPREEPEAVQITRAIGEMAGQFLPAMGGGQPQQQQPAQPSNPPRPAPTYAARPRLVEADAEHEDEEMFNRLKHLEPLAKQLETLFSKGEEPAAAASWLKRAILDAEPDFADVAGPYITTVWTTLRAKSPAVIKEWVARVAELYPNVEPAAA